MMKQCPCGSQKKYADCCETYITNQAIPPTPEALMRSRYTAYTQVNIDYIANTMKDVAAKDFNPEQSRAWAQHIQWLKLDILHAATQKNTGIVEFAAYYCLNHKKAVIHERSQFILEDGRWYYVDGQQITTDKPQKLGRNELCLCGSQKKYKKCRGKD